MEPRKHFRPSYLLSRLTKIGFWFSMMFTVNVPETVLSAVSLHVTGRVYCDVEPKSSFGHSIRYIPAAGSYIKHDCHIS